MYFTPKPYEFIEVFRDLLQKQNDFIEEHLHKCMEKAKKDIETLKICWLIFKMEILLHTRMKK